ncbi:hypothetical protein [Treponema sp.]|uniref:hypothetical protein n=1 Tax=Treponema sp. TaxID=166 RepID=UPI0025CCD2ED|nr:hypothetical protein [Treponema sp.]MCR5218971.1 hypothetical protein [Treponema sp.]
MMNKKIFLSFLTFFFCMVIHAQSEIKISKIRHDNLSGISLNGMAMESASVFFTDSDSHVYCMCEEEGKVFWKEDSENLLDLYSQMDFSHELEDFYQKYYDIEEISAKLTFNRTPNSCDYTIRVLDDSGILLPENKDGTLRVYYRDGQMDLLLEVKFTNLIESFVDKAAGKFNDLNSFIEFISRDYDEQSQKDDFLLKKYMSFLINEYFENENNFYGIYKNNIPDFINYYLTQLYNEKLRYDYEFCELRADSGTYDAALYFSDEFSKPYRYGAYLDFFNKNSTEQSAYDSAAENMMDFMEEKNSHKNTEQVFSIYDVIIPEVKQIRSGDFLKIKYGDDQYSLYFITFVEGYITSYKDFLNMTYVAGYTKDKKFSRSIHLQDLISDNEDFYCFRIMPLRNFPVIRRWNVFSKARIQSVESQLIYESDQTDKSLLWECIPNTGEYLACSKIKFDLRKSNHMAFIPKDFENYYVKISGARDPDENLFDNEGNYKRSDYQEYLLKARQSWEVKDELVYSLNHSSSFDIAFLDEEGFPFYTGKLVRQESGHNYKLLSDPEFEETPLLFLSGDGILKYQNGQTASIAVRPSGFENAYPGDEIKITFSLFQKKSDVEIASCDLSTILKVYDKKMIWRANLYVDERSDDSSVHDWNDLHPWNVPCDEKTLLTPWWWSEGWGFNNWNRTLFATEFDGPMNELPQGNGMQVITLPEYTSFRSKNTTSTIRNNISYDYNENGISAWDSPFDFAYKMKMQNESLREHFSSLIEEAQKEYDRLHQPLTADWESEPGESENPGGESSDTALTDIVNPDSGINSNLTAVSDNNLSGEENESASDNPCSGEGDSASDNPDSGEGETASDTDSGNIQEEENSQEINIVEEVKMSKGLFPKNADSNFPDTENTVAALSEWLLTTASEGKWDLYWKSSPEKNKAFIPGLGFLYHADDDGYYDGVFKEAKSYSYPDNLGAGTDCIGMIVRTASYSGSRYKWLNYNNMPPDKAECNELSTNKRSLSFPESSGSWASGYEVINWAFMSFDKANDGLRTGVNESQGEYGKYVYKDEDSYVGADVMKTDYDDLPSYRKLLLDKTKKYFAKAVPGDVIAYGIYNSMENIFLYNPRIRSHIGVVADIDYKRLKEARTFAEVARSVQILESVYGQLVFGSVKRNMVQSGCWNKRGLIENEDLSGSWFIREKKCQRCWAVQRLYLK